MRTILLSSLIALAASFGGGPPSTQRLYEKIDATLRRARNQEGGTGARFARSLGNRWTEMEPDKLVEATLVAGKAVLEDFNEGFELLSEAEDGAHLNMSGTAYSALMRLASSEERPVEALALLARTRAYSVERTDGLLLSAMKAAADLDDWGAVARLYAELAEGEDAAMMYAMELETIASDPVVLDQMRSAFGSGAKEAYKPPPPNEHVQALSLALQAHCERGDLSRVIALVERKRMRGAALAPAEYGRLWRLARRSGQPAPLLALRPVDLQLSLDELVQPRLWQVQGQFGMAMASLGVVERSIAAGLAAVLVIALVATAAGSGAPPANDDALLDAAVKGLY